MTNMKGKPESYLRYEQFRNESSMTDYQVSKESGVATATIYQWKAGKYEPKLDKMLKIAKVLGVNLEQLVGA